MNTSAGHYKSCGEHRGLPCTCDVIRGMAENAMLKDDAQAERRHLIAVTEPRSAMEQRALDAALFERSRAERYEIALRSTLLNLEQGSVAVAKAQIRIALLQ